jgi:hypothetical protein
MKLTGTTHRRTPITAWHHKPNTKDTVLQRIQTVTKELGAIQAEMHSQLTESAGAKTGKLLVDGTAALVLNNFKVELDQLRRILWFYSEEAAAKPAAAAVDQEQQAHRVQRVTELLRALSPPSATPAALAGEESGSFFERLNLVIDNYMQEKKPVAAESKAAPRTNAKAFS